MNEGVCQMCGEIDGFCRDFELGKKGSITLCGDCYPKAEAYHRIKGKIVVKTCRTCHQFEELVYINYKPRKRGPNKIKTVNKTLNDYEIK